MTSGGTAAVISENGGTLHGALHSLIPTSRTQGNSRAFSTAIESEINAESGSSSILKIDLGAATDQARPASDPAEDRVSAGPSRSASSSRPKDPLGAAESAKLRAVSHKIHIRSKSQLGSSHSSNVASTSNRSSSQSNQSRKARAILKGSSSISPQHSVSTDQSAVSSTPVPNIVTSQNPIANPGTGFHRQKDLSIAASVLSGVQGSDEALGVKGFDRSPVELSTSRVIAPVDFADSQSLASGHELSGLTKTANSSISWTTAEFSSNLFTASESGSIPDGQSLRASSLPEKLSPSIYQLGVTVATTSDLVAKDATVAPSLPVGPHASQETLSPPGGENADAFVLQDNNFSRPNGRTLSGSYHGAISSIKTSSARTSDRNFILEGVTRSSSAIKDDDKPKLIPAKDASTADAVSNAAIAGKATPATAVPSGYPTRANTAIVSTFPAVAVSEHSTSNAGDTISAISSNPFQNMSPAISTASGNSVHGLPAIAAGEFVRATAASQMIPVPANSPRIEVGYQDPTFGYVELRAHMGDSGVHAALITQSQAAGAALQEQLGSLAGWMHERRTPVESVTVLAFDSNGAANGGAASDGQQGERAGSEQRYPDQMPSGSSTAIGSPATETYSSNAIAAQQQSKISAELASSSQYQPSLRIGSTISVLA